MCLMHSGMIWIETGQSHRYPIKSACWCSVVPLAVLLGESKLHSDVIYADVMVLKALEIREMSISGLKMFENHIQRMRGHCK